MLERWLELMQMSRAYLGHRRRSRAAADSSEWITAASPFITFKIVYLRTCTTR